MAHSPLISVVLGSASACARGKVKCTWGPRREERTSDRTASGYNAALLPLSLPSRLRFAVTDRASDRFARHRPLVTLLLPYMSFLVSAHAIRECKFPIWAFSRHPPLRPEARSPELLNNTVTSNLQYHFSKTYPRANRKVSIYALCPPQP